MATPYLGYTAPDLATDYARYYNESIQKIPAPVAEALDKSPFPPGSLPPFSRAAYLQAPGYTALESGFTLEPDGSAHVAVLTYMPRVTPEMWDWWFGWHGCHDSRYKLWHPKAHLSARWEDGNDDVAYIGRNSLIEEYIGDELLAASIQFKTPTEFGISYEALKNPAKAVYIGARIGHPSLPLDYGYLIHQVRAVEGGSEMRSRFWMGGQYIQLRTEGAVANFVSVFLRKMKTISAQFAADLVKHCSEEMTHLAAFLPELYAQNTQKTDKITVEGRIIDRTDPNFETILLGTLFNKIDPGRRPDRIVEPKTVQDIIETIRYAKAQGKKVTVCSGGHSWSANHVRDNSVLILMKKFNRYEINVHERTAKAGPGVGGSALMLELYKHQLFFPAGHCKGVCIGGYLLQGGYGWNGRKTGMACESVIGLDIVTADGDFVHASATENPDLYWAARGSGGGFFGVVVCFHLKLFALPPYRAIIAHDFHIKHLEDVYNWAYEVGPSVPKAVEFQMLMSNNMLNLLGPGIEAIAPIFADTKEEYEDAMAFMKNSPIKKKAIIATPAFNPGIDALYQTVMSHYPENHCWGVDNMWTHAPIGELMPYIKEIARTLPPAPSHFLWLNWHPNPTIPDMAYSKEDTTYLALYANWKNPADTARYGDWAVAMMEKMAHLSTGIQLADEGLHKRTSPFLSAKNLSKLQAIRAERDPHGLFHEWHSKPE
ncbi:FAD-binding protein [Larkinella sp. C7]|uniref:DAPG hydrolase family protein n=1 Tax=Larkinella sp. C7 TaxID=2576607 RepID=UPI00111118C1|nr:FAD-binding protein [Larkinella sp. C7]